MKKIKRAVYREQLATLSVIDELIELERSKQYLKVSRSLYDYMTKELRYSEGAAMRRIHAARIIMKFPEVRELLRERKVSLCSLSQIATEVLRTGDKTLIRQIEGKSKREVESELAFLKLDKKKSPLKEQVRVIAPPPLPPSTATAKFSHLPPPPPVKKDPLYRMSFTATKEVYELVEEVKAGMSHKLSGKDDALAQLFKEGLLLLKAEVTKKRAPKNNSQKELPSTATRYVPRELKRAVFERDKCRCQYRLQDGTACGSTWQLEVDHIKPFSLGGKTELTNLRVTCRNHNQFLAQEARLL